MPKASFSGSFGKNVKVSVETIDGVDVLVPHVIADGTTGGGGGGGSSDTTEATQLAVKAAVEGVNTKLATALPLPTGAATEALQTTGNTSLAAIDADIGATTVAAAPANGTGDYSVIAGIKRLALGMATALTNWTTLLDRIPALSGGRVPVTLASGATPGTAAPTTVNVIAGTDGTNTRAMLTDVSGRQAVKTLLAQGVSRPLTTTAASVNTPLTAGARALTIYARTSDAFIQIGNGAQTAAAATSLFIASGERMELDLSVHANPNIAVIFGPSGAAATLYTTELN